jgi:reverse transcriptase-like protein
MSDKRQKNQLVLAFTEEGRSEAPKASQEGTESLTAKCATERPASHEQLMEEVCERENCWQAYKRVKANKGSPGIDGMKVGELSGYLKQHWPTIREQLLNGTYKPQPVRRVEIPKPGGGVRNLGIPTVLDRFIQQAVMQVLQRRWDPTFSEHSHGFRPKRSAHQAVAKAQQYIAAGHRWVVDLDLEKFFDRVNHDKLMAAIARRVTDKRGLRLIGAFLKVGVMSGTAGDDERHALSHATAQAQGEQDQECGGSARRAEVLGIQLQHRRGAQTARCAQGLAALQAEDPGADATDARNQPGTNDEGTRSLLTGLEELLRLLSDTLAAKETG